MNLINSELLLDLYGATKTPERWVGFLDRIRDDLGVANAAVQCLAVRGDKLEQVWCERDSRSMAMREVHDRLVNNPSNPRLDLTIDQTRFDRPLVRDTDRFAPDCPHFRALRERLRAAGLGESLCLSIPGPPDLVYSLVLHHGSDSSRSFDESDDRFLLALSPHVEQALSLVSRNDAYTDKILAAQRVLDSLRVGIVISSEGDGIDWANTAAEEIMGRSRHLLNLGRRGGFARFLGQRDEKQMTVLAAGEECELQILAIRLDDVDPGHERDGRGGIALLLVEPRRAPDLAPDELARVLGVTQGEGRIAAWLAGGGTLKDFAAYRGLSEGSVRNQAKHALAKAGVPRQADLVRHICSSIPGVLRGPIAELGK